MNTHISMSRTNRQHGLPKLSAYWVVSFTDPVKVNSFDLSSYVFELRIMSAKRLLESSNRR
jgi:hypothetical protein